MTDNSTKTPFFSDLKVGDTIYEFDAYSTCFIYEAKVTHIGSIHLEYYSERLKEVSKILIKQDAIHRNGTLSGVATTYDLAKTTLLNYFNSEITKTELMVNHYNKLGSDLKKKLLNFSSQIISTNK